MRRIEGAIRSVENATVETAGGINGSKEVLDTVVQVEQQPPPPAYDDIVTEKNEIAEV